MKKNKQPKTLAEYEQAIKENEIALRSCYLETQANSKRLNEDQLSRKEKIELQELVIRNITMVNDHVAKIISLTIKRARYVQV